VPTTSPGRPLPVQGPGPGPRVTQSPPHWHWAPRAGSFLQVVCQRPPCYEQKGHGACHRQVCMYQSELLALVLSHLEIFERSYYELVVVDSSDVTRRRTSTSEVATLLRIVPKAAKRSGRRCEFKDWAG
jgi:hypothetical protein